MFQTNSEPSGDNLSQDDVINVLLATDIHLGYAETNPIRGEDSFITFEEVLQTAQQANVDFLLLGGDLFHDSKPTPTCLHRCMSLLRKYCLGDRPVKIQFLSDQSLNFSHCQNPIVNYEDDNMNISLPVFSIHGNHDDPTGVKQLSSLDILSTMGLVNYFGKVTNLSNVELYPILLQKGITKLALYGLSHISDKRLIRLFRDDKVSIIRPADEEEWFSLLAVHQNRADRGELDFIPESVFPEFLNFILWGHEHDCRIDPEVSAANEVYISQPGSTVATSLSYEESGAKFVGLLSIHKTNFKFEKIKLKTVRPFIFQSSTLDDFEFDIESKKSASLQAEDFVKEEIDRLIIKSRELITGHSKQPTLPLIRIRVEYQREDEVFNVICAGQTYTDKVANPVDLILLKKCSRKNRSKVEDVYDADVMQQQSLSSRVDSKVEEYFADVSDKKKLQVLSVKGMCQALMAYIDKNDYDAIELLTQHQVDKTLRAVIEADVELSKVDDEINEVRLRRLQKFKEEEEEANNLLNNPDRERTIVPPEDNAIDIDESDDDTPLRPARGRGSRGGRGRGGGRGGRGSRGRGSSIVNTSIDLSPDEAEIIQISPTTRSGRRGRPSKNRQAESSPVFSPQNKRAATLGKNYIIDVSDSE